MRWSLNKDVYHYIKMLLESPRRLKTFSSVNQLHKYKFHKYQHRLTIIINVFNRSSAINLRLPKVIKLNFKYVKLAFFI